MRTITSFREIRRDGKIMDEGMSPKEILAENWHPDIVTLIQWYNDSRLIELRYPTGMLAQVVRDRSAVAALMGDDNGSAMTDLCVYNPDGTKRISISSKQTIGSVDMIGKFVWFEKPRTNLPSAFAIVYQALGSSYDFLLDIDATNGAILEIARTR